MGMAELHPGIDLIISSPLSRAYESAEIVADKLAYEKANIVVEPLLIERCFGAGESLTIGERREKYPNDIYPGMEPLEDMLQRARSVFEKIVASYRSRQNILVAAHGAILYAIVTAITNGRIAYGGKDVKFDPGSIHLIRYLDGVITFETYNT